MQKTLQNNETALDKTSNLVYNTDMRNNNNTNESNEMKTTKSISTTITYREWLIARNEGLTRADKKRAARAYIVKENEIMAARKAAKNFTK
jgi:hypothetical protein